MVSKPKKRIKKRKLNIEELHNAIWGLIENSEVTWFELFGCFSMIDKELYDLCDVETEAHLPEIEDAEDEETLEIPLGVGNRPYIATKELDMMYG